MTCHERDTELLLFGVGELSIWENMSLSVHLLTCANCRKRQSELADTSRKIAATLKPDSRTAGVNVLKFNPVSTIVTLCALIVLLGTLIFTVSVVYSRTHSHAAQQTDDGCSPGLPNDRCK